MTYQPSLFDGQTRKELGQQRVLHNVGDQWKEHAIDHIWHLAQEPFPFSSDDLRYVMEQFSPPHHPNAYGAAFSSAAKQKIIRKTGRYIKSKIPSCHSRMIAVWQKY